MCGGEISGAGKLTKFAELGVTRLQKLLDGLLGKFIQMSDDGLAEVKDGGRLVLVRPAERLGDDFVDEAESE